MALPSMRPSQKWLARTVKSMLARHSWMQQVGISQLAVTSAKHQAVKSNWFQLVPTKPAPLVPVVM